MAELTEDLNCRHLLLGEVDPATVASAHTQFGQPQVGPQTWLKPRGPVVNVPHVYRDSGHGCEEGFVGGRAIERVLKPVAHFRDQSEKRSLHVVLMDMINVPARVKPERSSAQHRSPGYFGQLSSDC